jgi:LemA protein
MKKGTMILLGVVAVVVIIFLWGFSAYNGMVTEEESVDSQWGNVENVYQRRADLIPNLVSTVKGYAAHESSTLEAVVEARAKATSVTISAENLDEASLKKFQEAQGLLSQSLGRLLAVSESYPDLKANENFKELQAQLEGTENRIAVERNRYNEAAKQFNVAIRRFPASIVAGIGGFSKKPYFQAESGASTAPKVEF